MSDEITFSTDTVQAVMKSAWKDPRTKANSQAVQLSAEFFKLFTIEAMNRASEEAKRISEQGDEVQVEHSKDPTSTFARLLGGTPPHCSLVNTHSHTYIHTCTYFRNIYIPLSYPFFFQIEAIQ
ncbi:unnamed protein product [Absidia cylindrospora]